jgi:hypothetical protein
MGMCMKKILALFFAIVSVSQLRANPDVTWSTPVTLSTATVNSSDPQVVMDPSGNITAAWVENGFIKAATQPVGMSFNTPVQISSATSGATAPRLGVDPSGNVTAIWIENSGDVTAATLPFGGSWSAGTTVSSSTATTPVLVVDTSGNAIAIWARSGTIETATQLFGGSWGTVSMLSSSNSDHPTLAVGGTTAVAVWHNVLSGSDILQYSVLTVGGSWKTAANVFAISPGFSHNYPAVTVDPSGNATLVWYRFTSQDSSFTGVIVLSSSLTLGAPVWSAIPTVISNDVNPYLFKQTTSFVARVASDAAGNVIAAWLGSSDASNSFNEANVKPFSGTWGLSGSNNNAFQFCYGIDLAVTSYGDAILGSMSFDGTNLNVQSSEGNIADSHNTFGFSAPITVSLGAENGFPRVAAVLSGSTVFTAEVWIEFNGSNTVIQAATGSGAVIAPPTGLSVGQSSTNYGVLTDFFNTFSWSASSDPNVSFYLIFRNGVVFTVVGSGGPLTVVDHNAVPSGAVTYGVATVDNDGAQSPIATITLF